ncbi:hypothetical protein [Myxococcus llanfairpwllgwyngyllgogerychwyrndrobwllllantysiliogogogochensis]|uniref:hypothetical protein n=1 Tax=Myxococcus llanfairpwllgwyngyllgogerychwyrndrobwllllantysiliogogogochensis TaxID=2590453 RepID=UPI001FE5EAE8|nr:hypothetical protein [Myxococcus llanfairpwllgwyngyllgogerychwyrndrobwllllantysiliogogogochensis]
MSRQLKHMDGKDFTLHWWEAGGHICFYNARGEVRRLPIRQLQEEAVKIACQHPSGIRLMPLAREVHNQHAASAVRARAPMTGFGPEAHGVRIHATVRRGPLAPGSIRHSP